MAVIKSLERFTIALAAGVTSNSATLTKGQTTANCVPFMTRRITTVASPVDDWSEQCLDVYFSGATVVVETSANTPRAITVEVVVIEFDPAEVTVQQGTYALTTSETAPGTAPTITAVTLANAALVHYWKSASTTAINDSSALRGRFTSTTALGFDRATASGAIDGHWYVFEAINGGFTVDQVDVTLASVASNTATIGAVTTAKTFLITTFTADSSTADDNAHGSIYVDLQDTTTIRVRRAGTTGTVVATVFAIEFSGTENVQRGIRVQATPITSENVALGAALADINLSMPHLPSGTSFKAAGFDETTSASNSDVQVALTLPDVNNITIEHLTNDTSTGPSISWEVIEWVLTSGGTTTPKSISVAATAAAAQGAAVISARAVAAGATGTATQAEVLTFARAVAAGATGTASLVKAISKTIAVTATATAAALRAVAKTIAAGATGTAAQAEALVFPAAVAAAAAGTASLAAVFIAGGTVARRLIRGLVRAIRRPIRRPIRNPPPGGA